MAEVGVDLTGHQPKRLQDLLAEHRFGQIVALSLEAWPEVQAGGAGRAENWPTPDPSQSEGSRESQLEAYRLTRQALQAQILERFGAP
jgi:protein-tyrosine-phosphatase